MTKLRRVEAIRGTVAPFTTMKLIQGYGEPPVDWNDPAGDCWMTWVEWHFDGQNGQRVSMRATTAEEAAAHWAVLAENYGFNKGDVTDVR
jgi:hypothetical protein